MTLTVVVRARTQQTHMGPGASAAVSVPLISGVGPALLNP